MPNPTNDALRLEAWLGETPGPHRIGQVGILPAETPGRLALRHHDDREAPLADLVGLETLADLRRIVKADAAGAFRPLRGAPNLRAGWHMGGLTPERTVEALDVIYPAAVAFRRDRERGALEPVEFAETARRQTGMYRITQVITAEQFQATVAGVCGGCLRRRLWKPHPHSHPAPAAPGAFPLLCPEACNYFVAQARERIVAERKGTEGE